MHVFTHIHSADKLCKVTIEPRARIKLAPIDQCSSKGYFKSYNITRLIYHIQVFLLTKQIATSNVSTCSLGVLETPGGRWPLAIHVLKPPGCSGRCRIRGLHVHVYVESLYVSCIHTRKTTPPLHLPAPESGCADYRSG